MSYWCDEAEKCRDDEKGLLEIKGWSVSRGYKYYYDMVVDCWIVTCGKKKWEMFEGQDGKHLDCNGFDRCEDQGFPDWVKKCVGIGEKTLYTFYSGGVPRRRRNKGEV